MHSNSEVSDRGDDGQTSASGEWETLDEDDAIHLRRANRRRGDRPSISSPREDVTVQHRPNLEEIRCSPYISCAQSRTLASVSN